MAVDGEVEEISSGEDLRGILWRHKLEQKATDRCYLDAKASAAHALHCTKMLLSACLRLCLWLHGL